MYVQFSDAIEAVIISHSHGPRNHGTTQERLRLLMLDRRPISRLFQPLLRL